MINPKEGLLLLWLLLIVLTPSLAVGESEGKTVLKESAPGSRSLRPFTIQDEWELRWDSTEGISVTLYTDKGEAVDALASPHSRALMMQLKAEVLHTLKERWTIALTRQRRRPRRV